MKSEKNFGIKTEFSATKTQRHKVSQRFDAQFFFRFHMTLNGLSKKFLHIRPQSLQSSDENPDFFLCALCETFAFFALKKCERTFLTNHSGLRLFSEKKIPQI